MALKLPPARDARYLQLLILSAYAITAREVFNFDRTHATTLACIFTAVVIDLALGWLYYKNPIFPLSALIIGTASSLLLDAPSTATYMLAAALAVASKAFITYRGKHIFNPANFGVVMILALLPGQATGMPQLFAGHLAPSFVFAVLGLLTVIYAKQVEVSVAWLAGFVVFALVRATLREVNPIFVLLPMLGPGFLLFTFHMISDPATSPRTRRYRIAFGLSLALVDAGFRFLEIPYGFFYALFGATALLPWIRAREGSAPIAPPAPDVATLGRAA
jgi:Na+-translocating ferredoxin:NAD+ oxidoreductase RnfD subunit